MQKKPGGFRELVKISAGVDVCSFTTDGIIIVLPKTSQIRQEIKIVLKPGTSSSRIFQHF